jgi:anti-anti-sigma factor
MPIETKQTESGLGVVTLSGRLVLGKDIERLESAVNDLVATGQKKIILDLTTLDYADSSGIGTFVSCLTAVRKAGGEMRMAGVNPRIQRLFQITGVNHLMAIYPTVAEAAAN